jgi:hypothetical protein
MPNLIQDARFAENQIRTAPRLSVFIVVWMTIAARSNLAVFSLLDALLLRPPSVRERNELIRFGG